MMRYDPKAPNNISPGPPWDVGDCGCPWPTRRTQAGHLEIIGDRTCGCAARATGGNLNEWTTRRTPEEETK